MKTILSVLFTLIPFAVHAQTFDDVFSGRTGNAAPPAAQALRVQVQYVGTSADTAFTTTADSAAEILKVTRARIIFVDTVRATPMALAKVVPSRIVSIRLDSGPAVIKQYGQAAKDGVLTVTTSGPSKSATPEQGHP